MDYGQLGQPIRRQHGVSSSSDQDMPMSKSQQNEDQEMKLWCHVPMEIERLRQVNQVLIGQTLFGGSKYYVCLFFRFHVVQSIP